MKLSHFSLSLATLATKLVFSDDTSDYADLHQKINQISNFANANLSENQQYFEILNITKSWIDTCQAENKSLSECSEVDLFQVLEELEDKITANFNTETLGRNLPGSRKSGNSNKCKNGKCIIPLDLSSAWNYGCWCSFGKLLMTGQGQAVNELDQICKNMQLCLRCAEEDAINQGETCDPKTQSFTSVFSAAFGSKGIVATCTDSNPTHCARNTCMCQTQLLADMIQLIFTGYRHDLSYLEGNFDRNDPNSCPRSKTQEGLDTECCGYYPARKPFSLNGIRECCDNDQNIFSNLSHKCCDSGVREIGMC